MAEDLVYYDSAGTAWSLGTATQHLIDEGALGMPPIQNQVSDYAQQDGSNWLGVKIKPRVLNIVFAKGDTSRSNYFTNRATYLAAMKPNASAGTLRKTLPNGDQYELTNVRLDGGMALDRQDQIGAHSVRFAARLIAYDPIWRKLPINSQTFALDSALYLAFPIEFPIRFGGSLIDSTVAVVNAGTWKTYPIITLTAPMTNPTITNQTTGKVIGLTCSIAAGRVVTIDLSPGVKTIVDDLGVSYVGYLNSNSDLSTFYLAAHPEASAGSNSIRVQASGAVVTSGVAMSWYSKFIGI